MSHGLTYSVHVSPGHERAGDDRLPDGSRLVWNPLAVTLITGDEDAVLVDTPFLTTQIDEVITWIEATGKNLTAIYATHGHGDHWFGTARVLERFPNAVPYATPSTIAMMHRQATTGRAELWDREFPGLIPADTPVVARPVPDEGLRLEGHELHPIEVGHTDTDDTTVLWVPDLRLVAAGDVVYNGIHQFIVEGPGGGFESWLRALDVVEALDPEYVVAGHKNAELPDSPDAIGQTRAYLQDVMRLSATAPTARAFFDEMRAAWPTRLNLSPLWYGSRAVVHR